MQKRPIGKLSELGWETHVWLVYSLPFLFTSMFAPFEPAEKALLLLSYVAFLFLYYAGYLIRDARVLWVVAGLNLIAIYGSSRNPSAASFFIYASSVIANGFGPKAATRCWPARCCSAPFASAGSRRNGGSTWRRS